MPKNPRATLAAVIVAATILTGCGTATETGGGAEGDAPVVLTTFTVLADMARVVGGDDVRVESITKVGAEIHGYEPTPRDITRASEADLILDNGLGLEAWFARFVASIDVPHVVVSEGVEVIDIAADAYAGLPNPHAWMSPTNAIVYVENIVDALSDLAPEHASAFAQRGSAYIDELRAIQDDLVDAVAHLPDNHRALVTCEGAFSYLARDAGLEEQYIWPVNAEQQATPQQIAATIEFVRDNEVPAVFCESTVSDKPMQQVVDATDAELGGILYVDSLSEADGPVPSYLELLRYDAELIAAALGGSDR